MGEHYYSQHPQAASHRRTVTVQLRSQAFTFVTDAGVFSKKGVDFGSELLIEAFREPVIPGKILDMGCGYGPIGIALSKSFPERPVMMADINERAAELAEENVRVNRVRARVCRSHLFEQIDGRFAAIVTNPPIRAGKKIVYRIFSEGYDFLESKGELWTVIQKKQGAPSALKALQSIFGTVDVVVKKKGYFVFCAKKD
ncbi:methyltransferase [Sporolactobacillus sp. CQH2019]|uniref:class I SAM-dependent methyltransferase n=1 Tax=Sporolactobacillus sp. CQH2019 TaxID=3023512 RepID=UPI002367D1A3|nr:methyltransferase [Sporolactobacillus sp. CQH2019]MDD9150511.1 methyltransferase [Sporolactobacillus sp. CQH2019]